MLRLRTKRLFFLLFSLLLYCTTPCLALEGMEFVDADDKTGYYVNLNSVHWEADNVLISDVAVVKAATNRLYVYTMRFDMEKRTYRILHSEVFAYDTRELLETNASTVSEHFYGPASMMQEIIDYILYPEGR